MSKNRPASAANQRPGTSGKLIQAGILAWILPGAGHFYLGHRGLAAVFFAAITFPFLTGVAIGGVKNSVNPSVNKWLFLAEMTAGGYTTVFYFISSRLPTVPPNERSEYVSYYPETDVAQIYLAAAGLMNVLAILDAMARAQSGGLPTFRREMRKTASDAERGGA